MVYKVFISQIKNAEKSSNQENPSPNLSLRVKCTTSQDEWRGNAFLNNQYLDKCHRWVNKGKYQCVTLNNNSEMELKVQIFKFNLKKVEKTDLESLK